MDQLSLFSVDVSSSKGSIKTFIETIAEQGGMSFSNNFDVEFRFRSPTEEKDGNKGLIQRFKDMNLKIDVNSLGTDDVTSKASDSTLLRMMCEEAQLPNVQAMTGTTTGIRQGEGAVNYAHTKMYTDFQLGWMCDANLTPLKFLNAWYTYMFGEFTMGTPAGDSESGNPKEIYDGNNLSVAAQPLGPLKAQAAAEQAGRNRAVKLRYPDQYQCDIVITKTEKGANAPNERASVIYTMVDCFPYAIDAVPLSYGASQVTKVTANFYYSKYTIMYNDIRQFKGANFTPQN